MEVKEKMGVASADFGKEASTPVFCAKSAQTIEKRRVELLSRAKNAKE